jgi:cell division protein FtsB
MDDDALYADLNSEEAWHDAARLMLEVEALRADLTKRDAEITELTAQNKALVEENAALSKNIVAIYNTAIAELQRKNREIAELRGAHPRGPR